MFPHGAEPVEPGDHLGRRRDDALNVVPLADETVGPSWVCEPSSYLYPPEALPRLGAADGADGALDAGPRAPCGAVVMVPPLARVLGCRPPRKSSTERAVAPPGPETNVTC